MLWQAPKQMTSAPGILPPAYCPASCRLAPATATCCLPLQPAFCFLPLLPIGPISESQYYQ